MKRSDWFIQPGLCQNFNGTASCLAEDAENHGAAELVTCWSSHCRDQPFFADEKQIPEVKGEPGSDLVKC